MKIPLFLLLPVITFASNIVINTETGTVIGSTVNYNGKSVKRFLGIPFAKPPLGQLRFKKTVPVEPWSRALIADTLPPSCVQLYPFHYPWVDKMAGKSEDCLYLNIWVPETASYDNPKAVMFWIFGGGLSTGSNRLPVYDGYVLSAEGDVIVVTVNYRLGIFGFLSTDTEDAPGNMGYFDVLEALKWTNKNIQAFGGDKEKITLFGNSVGGTISGVFPVSPLTTGLFRRTITQSGSAALLRFDRRKDNFELGQKVAKVVGCASELFTLKENPQAVVSYLREIPADVLATVVRRFKPTDLNTFFPIYGDEFLPVDPLKAFLSGNFQNVDVLGGNVDDEGSALLVPIYPELFGPYGERDPKINKSLGADMILQIFKPFSFKYDVVNHYLSGLSEYDYDAVRSQVYHSLGDFETVCPTIYLIEKFATRVKNAYYYDFQHQVWNTVYAPWMGVTHFTEVPFVFGRPLDNSFIYSQGERELSKMIIELWTSFAKEGVPSHGAVLERMKTNPFNIMFDAFSQCSGNMCSPLETTERALSSLWYPYPYIKRFYTQRMNRNYLERHLQNCEFFRSYYEFQ